MLRRVIVNSFHSVEQLKEENFEIVVSFDSHIDAQMGMLLEDSFRAIEKLSMKQRLAWKRQSAHVLLGRIFSKVILVIPMTALFSDAVSKMESLKQDLGIEMKLQETIHARFEPLQVFNIEPFVSPPENLKKLAREIQGRSVVMDLDIDYLEEFQDDCYTHAPQVKPTDFYIPEEQLRLGSLWKVLKFIKIVKPQLITVSELREKSFNKPNATFLFRKLRDWRYTREDGILLPDEEATELLGKYEYYWKTRVEKITSAMPMIIASRGCRDGLLEVSKKIAKAISEFPSFMLKDSLLGDLG